MSESSSRRQWLLGMVSALFGMGAAGAVARALPPEPEVPPGPPEPVRLNVRERVEGGEVCCFRTVSDGKVVIEYDARTGRLVLTLSDRDGKVLERHEEGLAGVSLSRLADRAPSPGGVLTVTYDACDGSHLSLVGTWTTLTYDSSRPVDPPV
jgi:hypothetical protein